MASPYKALQICANHVYEYRAYGKTQGLGEVVLNIMFKIFDFIF